MHIEHDTTADSMEALIAYSVISSMPIGLTYSPPSLLSSFLSLPLILDLLSPSLLTYIRLHPCIRIEHILSMSSFCWPSDSCNSHTNPTTLVPINENTHLLSPTCPR